MSDFRTESFRTASLQFDELIYLPAAIGNMHLSGGFRRFLDEIPNVDHELFQQWPLGNQALNNSEEDLPEDDEIADKLAEDNGFLAKVSTPVAWLYYEDDEGLRGWTSSWAYAHTSWIYAPAFDALVERAKAWAKNHLETDLARGVDPRIKLTEERVPETV